MAPAKKPAKPEVIRRGSVAVKIYTVFNRTRDRAYTQFALAYRRPDGKRIVRRFSDHGNARREAELAATRLAAGETDSVQLGHSARNEYARSTELLKPFGLSVYGAVEDYAKARSKLPPGVSLASVLDFYLAGHAGQFSDASVREVVDRFVASKRKSGRSEVHLDDLTSRLGRFADGFGLPLREVGRERVESFLDGLEAPGRNISNRTRRNYLRAVGSLYRFAAKQKLIPKEMVEDLAGIELAEAEIGIIEVFSVSEARRLLQVATSSKPELVPYLVIGAFAGLRAAEIQRLDWARVDFHSGYVEVTAENAKIRGRRRLVPLMDNLRGWLKPHQRPSGRIAPFSNMANALAALAERAGVPWKHNGLRHSFISYRCAMTKNVAQVSYEAGNSPSMIHTHYLNMRTEREAAEWFSIAPE